MLSHKIFPPDSNVVQYKEELFHLDNCLTFLLFVLSAMQMNIICDLFI